MAYVVARREEIRVGGLDLAAVRGDLAQGGHLVEHPEAAAKRGDGEIVAVDDEIAHGSDGHVDLKRLPMVAVVEGNVDAQLGGGVEQAILLRVFLDGVDVGAVGDSGDDVLPGLAAVVGAIDVGRVVGEAMAIDGGVGGFGIEVAGLDLRDLAPGGHRRRGDVVPVLAVVAGDVDEAVVGADPNGIGVERRGADGVDDAEAVGHGLVNVLGGNGIEGRGDVGMEARRDRG